MIIIQSLACRTRQQSTIRIKLRYCHAALCLNALPFDQYHHHCQVPCMRRTPHSWYSGGWSWKPEFTETVHFSSVSLCTSVYRGTSVLLKFVLGSAGCTSIHQYTCVPLCTSVQLRFWGLYLVQSAAPASTSGWYLHSMPPAPTIGEVNRRI